MYATLTKRTAENGTVGRSRRTRREKQLDLALWAVGDTSKHSRTPTPAESDGKHARDTCYGRGSTRTVSMRA